MSALKCSKSIKWFLIILSSLGLQKIGPTWGNLFFQELLGQKNRTPSQCDCLLLHLDADNRSPWLAIIDVFFIIYFHSSCKFISWFGHFILSSPFSIFLLTPISLNSWKLDMQTFLLLPFTPQNPTLESPLQNPCTITTTNHKSDSEASQIPLLKFNQCLYHSNVTSQIQPCVTLKTYFSY